MSRPWMPLYVADYLADTAHLSSAEHGAYLLLIMHYWTKGKLPDDEESIRRITRLTSRQWSQSRDVLRSLFGDQWRHKRVEEELGKAIEKSRTNSANAKQRHSERSTNAERTDTQPQSHKKDAASAALSVVPDPPPMTRAELEKSYFDRGKIVLGPNAGGMLKNLLKAKENNIALARAALEQASVKSDPREYIGAIIRGPQKGAQPNWIDGIEGVL